MHAKELLLHSTRYGRPETSGAPPEPSVLTSMLGPGFAVAVASPRLVDDQLFPEELSHVARAVEKRRAEFGTARVAARQALAQLSIEPCSLVPNRDRSPHWPPGVKGSISHTNGCCVVAVTRSTEIAGVGIDIEEDTPLQAELMPMVCTPEERLWVDGFKPASRRELAKIIFSAKEAFYKCQYAITQTQLDFHDVHLRIDLAGGLFSIARITPKGSRWDRIRSATGKFRRGSGFVLSTSTLLTSNVDALP